MRKILFHIFADKILIRQADVFHAIQRYCRYADDYFLAAALRCHAIDAMIFRYYRPAPAFFFSRRHLFDFLHFRHCQRYAEAVFADAAAIGLTGAPLFSMPSNGTGQMASQSRFRTATAISFAAMRADSKCRTQKCTMPRYLPRVGYFDAAIRQLPCRHAAFRRH